MFNYSHCEVVGEQPMTTTIIKQKKSQHQSVDFDEEISDAELIERLTPKTPPVPFEMLPKELQEGIREGLRAADEGRVVSDEEVFREIDEWLENDWFGYLPPNTNST
jgi:hypothetical protein